MERGLIFPFKGLIDECEALKTYAREVLDKKTLKVLDEARGRLESIQAARHTRIVPWGIPADEPLRTIWSNKESQPGNGSKHRIRAKFSFVWDIRRLDEGKWRNNKHFLLDGIASTVTTIVEEVKGEEHCLARWAVEVGDHKSPGTHFHFQVKPQDIDEEDVEKRVENLRPFFPKSLDIPRLPAPPMSPFLAIDLSLGELFQDRWKRHALTDSKPNRQWKRIHQARLLRFFKWQTECVKDFTGSPWMALKLAKPDRDLLVEDK